MYATWVQDTFCATRAVWLRRVRTTGSRAPAAMASHSSHSYTILVHQCLLRLTSLPLRLVPLASVSLTTPHELLFREDLLLVADWNRATHTEEIVSFCASDNALTERRMLLDAQAGVDVWALASDRLVLWNGEPVEQLLVYVFKLAICERASRRNRRPLQNSLGAVILLINHQNPKWSALFNEFSNFVVARIFLQMYNTMYEGHSESNETELISLAF